MTQGLEHPIDGDPAARTANTPTMNDENVHAGQRSSISQIHPLSDDQLVALHEVVKTLSREKNIHRALAVIAEKSLQLTSCTSTALALLDVGRDNLDFIAVAGRGAAEMIGQKVRVADALPGQTAITGEPLLAFSPSRNPSGDGKEFAPHDYLAENSLLEDGFSNDQMIAGHGGVVSAAVVPIFLEGKSIGSLAAINRQDGFSFGGSDLLILHILASAASTVLQTETLRSKTVQTERERDILFESAQKTSSTLNVQQILDGVMATIGKSINSFAEIIFLLNDERTHLFIASERGLTEEELEIQLLAEDRLASAAFAGVGGTPYIIASGSADSRYEAFLPEERVKPASLLVVPLMSRDNPVGLIVVASVHPNAFTADDLKLVSAVAAQTAVAVENAWLYEDATRRAEEATAIYELSQSVNTNLNLQRVLNFVADSVISLLHVDKFALFLHNPRTNQLEIKVSRNLRRATVNDMRYPPDRAGIAGWVYQFETPTAVPNVAFDHRNRSCPIDQENVSSLVSVPLQAGDEVIGVIHAMSSRPRLFTVAEMELLYTIANQIGVAIRNTQTLEDMRQKSVDLRRASRLVSKALGASLDSSGAAQTIADFAAQIVAADRCILYTYEHGHVHVLAAHGIRITPPPAHNHRLNELETTAAWIARKGKFLILSKDNIESRLIVPSEYSYLNRSGSYIGIPLKIGSDVVGVLEAFIREPRKVTSDDLRQFKAFGGQAAVALQNAALVHKATRRRTDLQMLSALASELAAGGDSRQLIFSALRQLGEAIGADLVELNWQAQNYIWHNPADESINADNAEQFLTVELKSPFPLAEPTHLSALTIYRGSGALPFGEPDRYLTQTVADILSASVLPKN
jgi:GAF domain-containing protein